MMTLILTVKGFVVTCAGNIRREGKGHFLTDVLNAQPGRREVVMREERGSDGNKRRRSRERQGRLVAW